MAAVFPSNVKAILRGVQRTCLAVAPTVSGQPSAWTGSKIYAGPTLTQLQQAGTPFLAVNRPQLVGYTEAVVQDYARGIESTEPVWDVEILSFHPYDADYPNYDDAMDDANNLWQAFMANYTIPFASTIASATTQQITVAAGDGSFFSANTNLQLAIPGMPLATIESVAGDVLTLAQPLPQAPAAGLQASQGTCYNSYPYSVMPDYVELSTGGSWCVGYLVVRAFEQLTTQF